MDETMTSAPRCRSWLNTLSIGKHVCRLWLPIGYFALAFLRPLGAQSVELRAAGSIELPGVVDSNSPAHWQNGSLYLFNSSGLPVRSEGSDQGHLGQTRAVLFDSYERKTRWIEATWLDEDGTLYAWYHYEPGAVCEDSLLTAPRIGALLSTDGGRTFTDLGIVLESGDEPDCGAQNGFFAGGHGDVSVVLDRGGKYFYFFFGNYGGHPATQGIAMARMAFEDRRNPIAHVWKYDVGGWASPGLRGTVTPVLPAAVSWSRRDTDSFWGPSIHWNTHLRRYAMLLNRACCAPGWPQEGVYVTFSADLSSPSGWTTPAKILETDKWYPQVLGFGAGGTDKISGQAARLFVGGHSEREIFFVK